MCLVDEISLSRIFSLCHSYCSQLLSDSQWKRKKKTKQNPQWVIKHEKHTQLAKNNKNVSLSHTEVTAAVNTEEIRYHCTSTMYGELHSQTVGQNKSFLTSLLRCCHRSRSSKYTKAPKAVTQQRKCSPTTLSRHTKACLGHQHPGS